MTTTMTTMTTMTMTMTTTTSKRLALPLTRNHHQLASWINDQKLVNDRGYPVVARTSSVVTSTDTKVAGTRFRRVGRGRKGLLLEIWLADPPERVPFEERRLYRHESSETYRKHSEARAWVEQNLRRGPR